MSYAPAISACPACSAAPLAQSIANKPASVTAVQLSLPGIHCAACIAGVERALLALSGVTSARVNLSLKRVTIEASGLEPETLIDALAVQGYEALPLDADLLNANQDPTGRALLVRLAVAGFAMMNVMLFSVAVWSGASAATQVMFHWLSAGIAVPALLFSAQVFVKSAWKALKVGRLNMDVPISLAIILAAGLSVFETAQGGTHVYFDAALSLTFFLLVGRYLDHRTRVAARSASQELTALETPRAIRIEKGARRHISVSDLALGDTIAVLPGMRLPVDGTVIDGSSDLDRSLLTGESLPVHVTKGAELAAGEMNLTGPLTLKVTATGDDTTLRRMAAMVEVAEGARNRYTALADRAAQIYAPAVHLLALVTFIGWMVIGAEVSYALNIAISVLIITCPCALGLAVPAVMTAASGRLFRHGLLVKDGTALERLAEVDTVLFDKTGTLTTGQARLDAGQLEEDALPLLAALSQSSNHPVSRALAAALPDDITPAQVEDIRERPGLGVEAKYHGQTIRLGKGSWVGAEASPAFRMGTAPAVPLQYRESLREGAQACIRGFKAAGFTPEILSGDTNHATQKLAKTLGGIAAQGELTPQGKTQHIQSLSDQEHRVLMVGDGLNDTAALRAAYVSISPASALDASRAASDFVLLGKDMAALPEAVRLARSARARVLENFAIAAGYNMIAIPIAIMGFATPLSAAIAMSASSITVLLNALRVR